MERIADYIIRKLNQVGIEHIFLVTGRGILYLTDAVAKNQKVEGVSTYHEQGASYAAMAYAAAKEQMSACLISTGCAATNAVTACLCAYQDNLPVVFISGNNILNETTRYTGVNIRTYGSQETDIISIVESITKYAVMISDKNRVAYEIEKALFIANDGRKGPVWIDVPLDVQNARIEEEKLEHFEKPACQQIDVENYIDMTVEKISDAKRPIVLVGGGVAQAKAKREIEKLVEKTSIPIVFSPSASDVYGSANELSLGALGSLGGTRTANFAVQNSDYLLVLGSRLCSQETGMKDAFAREACIYVVDIDPDEHTKSGVHIDQVINMDVKLFLEKLLERELSSVSVDWVEKCKYWKNLFSIKNEPFVKKQIEDKQIDLYLLADILSDRIAEDATIITDAGFEELIIPSNVAYRGEQRCLFPASQGAMGYAIPAIIGAYYGGKKNIMCIVGDGSVMMNMQELGIISSHNIPAKILIINNNMYSVIRKRQKDLFRNRTIGNDPSDGVPSPNFKSIATSVGMNYVKIESLSDLLNNINMLTERNSIPTIYEIMCTPDQKYLHESYAVNEKKRLEHRPIEDMAPFLDRKIIEDEMLINRFNE